MVWDEGGEGNVECSGEVQGIGMGSEGDASPADIMRMQSRDYQTEILTQDPQNSRILLRTKGNLWPIQTFPLHQALRFGKDPAPLDFSWDVELLRTPFFEKLKLQCQ